MLRRIIILLILIAAIAGTTYYFTHRPVGQLTLTGIVTTDDIIVSAQVTGRLQELKVKQGDTVKKDDLIAIIAPEQWQADMAYYQQLEKQAATQTAVSEADLQFAEAQANAQIAQAKAAVETAKAQITQVQADVENARLTFVHTEEAYKHNAESIQTFDQTRMAYEAQKARLEATQRQRDAAESAVAVAEANLKQVDVRRESVAMSQHQTDAAKAQIEKARVQLAYTQVLAPADGIVDVRAARQGEVVNPAQAIVTLINPDDLWVRIDVEETYIDKIHLGDTLNVRLPSGDILPGTVIYRAVDADFATQRDVSRTKRDIRTFEVRLRCDNKDRKLAVGMTAYVTFNAGSQPIPASQPTTTTSPSSQP